MSRPAGPQVIDKPRLEFKVHRLNWVSGSPPEGLENNPAGLQVRDEGEGGREGEREADRDDH